MDTHWSHTHSQSSKIEKIQQESCNNQDIPFPAWKIANTS